MTFLDAKETLCSSKLNINYDEVVANENQLFSLQDIEDAINYGVRKTWDYKLWPFTEGVLDLNGVGLSANPFTFADFNEGFVEQSFFLLIVNGVPWDGVGNGKRNFRDFMKWITDYPSDTSKIWAEYGGNLYFNVNAMPGTYDINLYGKERAPIYGTDDGNNDDSPMPFSAEDVDDATTDGSGNNAIIEFAFAFLLAGEKKKNPSGAAIAEKNAIAMLDTIWAFITEGKSQNLSQNRPFFNAPNFFPGRPNRGNTNIGNFP